MKKFICTVLILLCVIMCFAGCESAPDEGAKADVKATIAAADILQEAQPTPTDIDYSLERYNLTRRAYWVNGQRDKARTYPCPIADIPLGYVVLFTESGGVVGKFVVEGKVTSLNSFLTPDSEYYSGEASAVSIIKRDGGSSSVDYAYINRWLADIDGSYGENDNGIFFFTPDGKYLEWTGIYLYSDIPFEISDPVLKVGE